MMTLQDRKNQLSVQKIFILCQNSFNMVRASIFSRTYCGKRSTQNERFHDLEAGSGTSFGNTFYVSTDSTIGVVERSVKLVFNFILT
jgi:hypothetical protein